MVTFTLHQVTAIVTGPAYSVTNEVTMATDASLAAYVFQTDTQTFSHYATAADIETWPDSLTSATFSGAAFYRLSSVTRTWETVVEMNTDLATSIQRLQSLADELNAQQGALTIDRTTVIQGA